MYAEAMNIITTGNLEGEDKLRKKSQKITELDIKMRKNHMQRVNKGKCKAGMTASFNRILGCIDRMGNSCVNIAEAALSGVEYSYFIKSAGGGL